MPTGRTHRTRHRRRGFTLIEAIVIIVILGVLASVIGLRIIGRIGESKQSVAASNARNIANAMQQFLADHGSAVNLEDESILVLVEPPDGVAEADYQPYVQKREDLQDPWGNDFVLVAPGEQNLDFDIVSYGRDGEPGGEGEDADIIMP
jgi:general secretion pathway protein G